MIAVTLATVLLVVVKFITATCMGWALVPLADSKIALSMLTTMNEPPNGEGSTP